MDPALFEIARVTRGTVFEGGLWLVGGAVRDSLLGAPQPADLDIVLESDALDLAQLLRQTGVSDIEPVVYPRFGTALIMVGGANVELITARRESYNEMSRKPNVEPATLKEDALRRDFTVNTLLRNIHTGEMLDPTGCGLKDLNEGILRTPLEPKRTFYDDPLRMLRAVRFRWKLGFTPAPGLYESVRQEAHRLDIISAERIRDEWVKMLSAPTATAAMRDLMDLGLLDRFAPEFHEMVGVDQGKWHHLDVWEHSLLVVDNLYKGPTRPQVGHVLGALLHDIGKPRTRILDADGEIRFFGHETTGAAMSEKLLRRLKFSNEDIEPVVALVKNHMRLGSFDHFTSAAARRLLRDMGDQTDALLALVEADAASLKPGVRSMDLTSIRERLDEVRSATPVETLESPLSGDEIMAITGVPPGPEVGRIKAGLLDEVLEGRILPGDTEHARVWVQANFHA